MRNYQLPLFLLCVLLFCSSCNKTSENKNFSPDLLAESTDIVNYSTFVDSIHYIPLETNDECLIGKIGDVIITPQHIFVSDEQKQVIWIFNPKGEYLNNISRQGNGPEEYMHILQFEYDKQNNQIAILDWNKWILYYDLNGGFIRRIKLDIDASDFKILPQGEGYIISNAGDAKPEAGIFLTDANGKTIKYLVKRNPEQIISYNDDMELLSYKDTITFISPNFENNIYHFYNNQLELKYPFTFHPLLKHTYKEDVSKQYLEDFLRNIYLENEKWIFIIVWSSVNDIRNFLYSKEKNQYWIGKSIENDIDGVHRSGLTTATENNQFVFICEDKENPDNNPSLQVLHLK